MSVGRVLTLGLGTPFSSAGFLVTLGLGASGTPPAVVADSGTAGLLGRSAKEWHRLIDAQREVAVNSRPLPATVETAQARHSAYFKQSVKLAAAINERRAEIVKLRARIVRLEAQALAAKIAERAILEHRLLLAQQRMILARAQEAMLLEEMEAIDIAFIAVVAIGVLQ